MNRRNGSVLPSEARESRDERTGARVVQLTSDASINHHLYPLACSTTPDGGWVVFASNRSGAWQFYKARFPAGEILQLTDLPGGLHGYSGHLTPDGQELLYTAAGQVRGVDIESLRERVLASWPGASLGEVSLSHTSEWLVTAMEWQGRNYLAVAAADGSRAELVFESERTLIHPQFHPTDDTWIEYSQDPAPRVWLIRRDGAANRCLYEHENDEFVVHETWLGTTGDLVYTRWPFELKRLSVSGVQVFRCSGVQDQNRSRSPEPTQDEGEHEDDSGPEHLNTRTPEHLIIARFNA